MLDESCLVDVFLDSNGAKLASLHTELSLNLAGEFLSFGGSECQQVRLEMINFVGIKVRSSSIRK